MFTSHERYFPDVARDPGDDVMPLSILTTLSLLVGAAILPLCAQEADTSDARKLAPGTRVRLTVDAGGDSATQRRGGRRRRPARDVSG